MLPTEHDLPTTIERDIAIQDGASSKTALMRELFDEGFSFELPDDKKKGVTSLFKTLERYAFDGGLNKNREFSSPTGEIKTSEPVLMYNRSSFLHLASRTFEKNPQYQGCFYMVDIAKLRDADLAIDSKNNKAADYVLNKIAGKIQEKMRELKERNNKIEVCRYGGDEFMFLVDEKEPEKRQRIMEEIEAVIKEVKGFYIKRDEKNPDVKSIVEEPVALKMVKPIKIPLFGSKERTIFDYYLHKGLVLTDEDILKIKLFNHEGIGIIEKPSSKSIYPEGLIKKEDTQDQIKALKISYLVKQHPELKNSFQIVGDNPAAQQSIINFVENIMYDRLLNEVVLGFTDLEDHIIQGDYKHVELFDMKFIKEINDKVSIVEGDKAIIELWKEIKKVLEDLPKDISTDKRDVQVHRRGGTFAIAFSENVSKDTIAKFNSLKNKMVKWNGTAVPIGSASWEIDEKTRTQIEEDRSIRVVFEPVLKEMGDNWLEKIGDIELVEEKAIPERNGHTYSLADLVHLYFTGEKRAIERNQGAIEYFNRRKIKAQNEEEKNKYDRLIAKHRSFLEKAVR